MACVSLDGHSNVDRISQPGFSCKYIQANRDLSIKNVGKNIGETRRKVSSQSETTWIWKCKYFSAQTFAGQIQSKYGNGVRISKQRKPLWKTQLFSSLKLEDKTRLCKKIKKISLAQCLMCSDQFELLHTFPCSVVQRCGRTVSTFDEFIKSFLQRNQTMPQS